MKIKLAISIVFVFFLPRVNAQAKAENIRLFFLGGQSNMTGFGFNKDLPNNLKKPLKNVFIFQGNPVGDEKENGGVGNWELVKPGHGLGFTTDGGKNRASERFGVELSFASRLRELYPNEKIAIIKYARNGSSLDSLSARKSGSWEVDYKAYCGINQFDHFLTTVRNAYAVSDIDNNGIQDNLIPSGIVWMQGESDTYHESAAMGYHENLSRLLNLMYAAFRKDDIAVVLGKISDSGNNAIGKVWKFGELVQSAQEKYASENKNAIIVRSTKYYGYTDPYHYNSAGYLDLGEKFAEAIYQLNSKCSTTP